MLLDKLTVPPEELPTAGNDRGISAPVNLVPACWQFDETFSQPAADGHFHTWNHALQYRIADKPDEPRGQVPAGSEVRFNAKLDPRVRSGQRRVYAIAEHGARCGTARFSIVGEPARGHAIGLSAGGHPRAD
jgi:hypothetical protein